LSTRYLKSFFRPESIAVVGASERSDSFGGAVLKNIVAAGFQGRLYVINRKGYARVHGIACYKLPKRLPEVPDLVIVTTPPATIPGLIKALGKHGVRAVLILMGAMARQMSRDGTSLREAALEASRPFGMRIMGPNSLGIMVPGLSLNASYAHLEALPGKVAFVGQSAMLGTSLLDWARGRELGFSHFLTLGDALDVGAADVIDYLASDHDAKALLLHLEHVADPRRFIAAVRVAARAKPVLAFKTRDTSGIEPGRGTPGIANREMVWEEVFRRTGVLRVESAERLLEGLSTLVQLKSLAGSRLAVMANGDGPALLAYDWLRKLGGEPAVLGIETSRALTAVLPSFIVPQNPINLNANADPERYRRVLEIVSADAEVDAVLVIHAPLPLAPGEAFAKAVIEAEKRSVVLTCWMGLASVSAARAAFSRANIPTFLTPEQAVRAFVDRTTQERNKTLMQQTPPPLREARQIDREAACSVLAGGDEPPRVLMPDEARSLLVAYGIPCAELRVAATLDEAVEIAAGFDGPIALKVLFRDRLRPFTRQPRERGWRRGVALEIDSAERLRAAAESLLKAHEVVYPEEKPRGWGIQRMRRGMASLLLSFGITRDPVFGPLILFGEGGSRTKLMADRQVALPPLNETLARALIARSRVPALLEEQEGESESHVAAMAEILMRLSRLAIDFPQIEGLEINPMLIRGSTLLALDTTVAVGAPVAPVIASYPDTLTETMCTRSGETVILRPIRGEDEPAHARFAARLSAESVRLRFFTPIARLSHKQLAQLTQIDYDREMAFIAATPDGETLGVVRGFTDGDNFAAEIAIIVRDDQKGKGLGKALMAKIIGYCRQRGTIFMGGTVLPENAAMQGLARAMGFRIWFDAEGGAYEIGMVLNEPCDDWQKQRLNQVMPGS